MESKLPKHDTIESVPAGHGWHADVAFRGDKLVGVVVAPDDAGRIPDTLELRDVSLSDARGKSLARADGIDFKTAKAAVIKQRRKVPPSRRGKAQERNHLVGLLVLQAQDRGEPRYLFLRTELPKLGYTLGKEPIVTVKRWVEASTAAGYLEKKGSGRGPRSPGPRLRLLAVDVPMPVKLTRKVIRAKKGKKA
jgi:hypothetical protein